MHATALQTYDQIASASESDHLMLILLAHDGDNAFGGGYSYYEDCVKNFVQEAHVIVSNYCSIILHSLELCSFANPCYAQSLAQACPTMSYITLVNNLQGGALWECPWGQFMLIF